MYRVLPPAELGAHEALSPEARAGLTSEAIRARAREMVLAEFRHQPTLRAGAFLAGLLTGLALAGGAVGGYCLAVARLTGTA